MWQDCRHCGTPVRPSESGTYQVDAGGWDHCPDQERSHEPVGGEYITEETP